MSRKRSSAAVGAFKPSAALRPSAQLDEPASLLACYRRWSDSPRGATPSSLSISENEFRAALQKLRGKVRSREPILRPTAVSPLAAPAIDHVRSPVARALRAGLWRRQLLFNNALAEVVNTWPRHAQAPGSLCWLKDSLRPLLTPSSIAGSSHRPNALTRTAVRSLKTIVTTAVALTQREDLERVAEVNQVLYRGIAALVSPQTQPDEELERLVDDLLALHASPGFSIGHQLGFPQQAQFIKDATLMLASLILPGEAALKATYPQWRTRSEQRALPATLPGGTVTLILAGAFSPAERESLLSSIECQPGSWECFQQAETRSEAGPGRPPVLSLAEIRPRVTGDWVALVTEPASFAPSALIHALIAASQAPSSALIYSDHDEGSAVHSRPFFKPGWSPDLFMEVNYVGGVLFVSRAKFDAWSQRLERITPTEVSRLILFCHAQRERITRIPRVLWHRLGSTPDQAGHAEAVGAWLCEQKVDAQLQATPGGQRVRYKVQGEPRVSIVVPFKDKPELLEQLLASLASYESYPNYEVILVSNNSKNRATFRLLSALRDPRIKSYEWNKPFNYQTINNEAVQRWCTGEFILFLNNDVSWTEGGAIGEMLGHCQRPEIGVVGANLLFPNGRLQHAGVALGIAGFAAHPFSNVRPNAKWTAYGRPSWTRNYLAVTAACMMVRRAVFDQVGGFDEEFIVSGGDVDLCLRIGALGYRVVNTPHVGVIHHESATRGGSVIPDIDAWKSYASFHRYIRDGDPYYNPNLSLTSQDCLPRTDGRTGEELAAQLLSVMLTSSRRLVPD